MTDHIIGALVALAIAFLFAAFAPVKAGPYTDGPTAEWFRQLSSPYFTRCCDQADCRRAASDFHDGAWWAKSNKTGTWVRIAPSQITTSDSVFAQAVLCESEPVWTAEGYAPWILCFARPPSGA